MKKILIFLLVFLSAVQLMAQDDVEMATGLRSSGKIYVVVTVVAVIFIGLAIYLFSIDRRLKRLEKKN